MDIPVKIMGAIDIVAAVVILLGDYWIGLDVIAFVLLLKGIVSLLS